MQIKTAFACLGACLTAACLIAFLSNHTPVHAATVAGPMYASNGDLLPLKDYRQWVYVTSGIDMSYSPKADAADHSMFDNVFVNPEAYQHFVATGKWPDKTILVLEIRGARSKGSINQRGHFQDADVMGFEVHVKDEARFPGKWAFFDFDSPDKNGTLIPQGAPCYTCHSAHAASDTTFVQFYPTLLPIAREMKTLSPEFLKEEAEQGAAK